MRRAATAYALAVAALAAALLIRWLLSPWLGHALPFITMFGAVAAAVWVGGYRPAIVVTVLGYAACAFHFGLADVGRGVGLAAYLSTCAFIIGFGEAMRVAQARAIERRELLRVTLGSIGDAVITTDLAGRITYLNAVAESSTGWRSADALGRPLDAVFRIVNEATRLPVESPATRALRDGVVMGLANHTLLIRKDGGELPIDDSAAPIRDAGGAVSGCVLIFRDVTAQRQVENERASQLLIAQRLAAIVESSDDAIIGKSLDGTIQSWNAGAERIYGYRAEQAVGRHISLLIPSERLVEEEQIIASLKAGKRVEYFETERLRASGERIVVSLTVSPIKDATGEVVGASKIARDVTEERRAAERERLLTARAAEAHTKLAAFFEQGALFAGIMDLDGTLLETNRLSWEGCGFRHEETVGIKLWEGPWWSPSPELVERIHAAYMRAIEGETFRAEVPYFVGDGSERFADLTIQPIRDEAGQIVFLAPTAIDVTERKRLEADLRALAADLSEADRRKNEFVAMLAHELRNPLAPIASALQILQLRSGDAEAVRTTSAMLERQLRQMARLVDDLLDMSRITRGKIELRKEPVALAPIVEQAVDAARALELRRRNDIDVTLPPEPIHLDADPIRLAQVIGNLLSNATKFTDDGGRIEVAIERRDGHAEIRVRDDGIGIAGEHLPHVFEMFMQADTSLERARDGLGIGLTLVRTLVEMHGGTVEARSEGLGRGSEFVVRLPVMSQPLVAPAKAPDPEPTAAPRRRILIVDDNRDGADSLALLLTLRGHETHTAYDGVEGLATVERLRPDAVLLDIGLPKLDGYEVCRRIRRQPWGRDILLVAVTGWGQDEDLLRSREAGFDTHLVKPVTATALTKLLALPPRNAG